MSVRPVHEILRDVKTGKKDAMKELMRHPVGRYRTPRIFKVSNTESLHRDILEALGAGDAEKGKKILLELNKRRHRLSLAPILKVKKGEEIEEYLRKEIITNPVAATGKIVHLLVPEHRIEDHALKTFSAVNITLRLLDNKFLQTRAESQYKKTRTLLSGLKERIRALEKDPYAPRENYTKIINTIDEIMVSLDAAVRSGKISGTERERITKKMIELRKNIQSIRQKAPDSRMKEWKDLLEKLQAKE